MTNTEISNNNPEKALKKDKSISDDKTKEISGKNATQNKKITQKNYKSKNRFSCFLIFFKIFCYRAIK